MKIKIIDVKVHVIKSSLEIPFAFSQGWVNVRSATLVEIKTNSGFDDGKTDAKVFILFFEYSPSITCSAVPVLPAISYPSTFARPAVPSLSVTIFLKIFTNFSETSFFKIDFFSLVNFSEFLITNFIIVN